jgi:hypothetical protein
MLRKWWRSFLLLVLRRAPFLATPPQAAEQVFPPPLEFALSSELPTPPPQAAQPQAAQPQAAQPRAAQPQAQVATAAPPSEATSDADEASSKVEEILAARRERRQLELARIHRDVLVEPKLDHVEHDDGPPALKAEPKPKKKRKKKVEAIVEDDDAILADELVEGDGEGEVLFEERELYGEFNFRDSILDQLERYWFYLRRMRMNDKKIKDAFDFYRQVGAVLIPHASTGARRIWEGGIRKMTEEELVKYQEEIKLTKWFEDNRPGWGCIVWGASQLSERREREGKVFVPRFMYFTKYSKAPPECQPPPGPGDVYVLTIWWDSPIPKSGEYRRHGVPDEIPIFVSADCKQIIALKRIETRMIRIGKRGNNFSYELIPERAWHFPAHYERWASSHGLTVELHLPHLFCSLMRDYERSQGAAARVSVTKGDLTATFGINPRRLPYFFRDRDIIVTVNGQRKRIMHYVKAHTREDGTEVKDHFRGARAFKWAGYDVLITIPGRDHMPLHEFNVGVIDTFWKEKGEKLIGEPAVGHALSQIVHGVDPIDALNRAKASASLDDKRPE